MVKTPSDPESSGQSWITAVLGWIGEVFVGPVIDWD
jgi:hypothetical protein